MGRNRPPEYPESGPEHDSVPAPRDGAASHDRPDSSVYAAFVIKRQVTSELLSGCRYEVFRGRVIRLLDGSLRTANADTPPALAREVLSSLAELSVLEHVRRRWVSVEALHAELVELLDREREQTGCEVELPEAGTSLGEALDRETQRVIAGARPVSSEHRAGYSAGFAMFGDHCRAHVQELDAGLRSWPRPGIGGTASNPHRPNRRAPRDELVALRETIARLPAEAGERRSDRERRVFESLDRFRAYWSPTRGVTAAGVSADVVAALPELELFSAAFDGLSLAEERTDSLRAQLATLRDRAGLSAEDADWRMALARQLRRLAGFAAGGSGQVGTTYAAGFDSATRRIARTLTERARAVDVADPR